MAEQESLLPNEKRKSMTREELTVPDGTSLGVAVSSLIKELRRGNEFEALYWARELEQRYYRYLWRRLLIFCSEDVGIANPNAIVEVVALREAYMITNEESKNARGDFNFVAQAVFVLARSAKSKETGFAHMVMSRVVNEMGWRAKPPEYALDMHTAEGRRMLDRASGEMARHWFQIAQVVTNREGPRDWELWWARSDVVKGLFTSESIEAYAAELAKLGLLKFGVKGPESAPNPYLDPETGEVIDEDPKSWHGRTKPEALEWKDWL